MYLANPVVLFGCTMLVLGALAFLWRTLAKSEGFKTASDMAVRLILPWGVLFILVGGVMGMSHSRSHADCLNRKAAHKETKGCDYFFEHYGG